MAGQVVVGAAVSLVCLLLALVQALWYKLVELLSVHALVLLEVARLVGLGFVEDEGFGERWEGGGKGDGDGAELHRVERLIVMGRLEWVR